RIYNGITKSSRSINNLDFKCRYGIECISTMTRPAARVTVFRCAVRVLKLPDRGEKMSYRSSDLLKWISIFILILLTLGHAQSAPAQGQKGAISGIVTDESGAVLKGAQVTIAMPVFNAVSDEQGRFYINDLAPGIYNFTISYV